jgi:hypothetical protein
MPRDKELIRYIVCLPFFFFSDLVLTRDISIEVALGCGRRAVVADTWCNRLRQRDVPRAAHTRIGRTRPIRPPIVYLLRLQIYSYLTLLYPFGRRLSTAATVLTLARVYEHLKARTQRLCFQREWGWNRFK